MTTPSFEAVSSDTGDGTTGDFTGPVVTDANYAIITHHWLRADAAPTGHWCKFDNIDCVLIGSHIVVDGDNRWGILMWEHPNPGSEGAITMGWTESGGYWVNGCCTYKDVGLIDPHGTLTKASGDGTAISVTVVSDINQLVIDAAVQNSGSAIAGAGQTERLEVHDTAVLGMGSDEPGAASVVMSWTGSEARAWVSMGVPLKPHVPGNQVLIFA